MLVANVVRSWRFAMNYSDHRDMWAGRIERYLTAGTTVKEWCALNRVAES